MFHTTQQSTYYLMLSPSRNLPMADPQYRYQDQKQRLRPTDAIKNYLPDKGPTKSQVLAIVLLLPVGGALLLIGGLFLGGTLLTLALATPLFIIFSPILVPAAIGLAMAVAGILTAGAFGISALSSFSWIFKYMRKAGRASDQMEHTKRRVQDTVGHMGHKAKEVGHKAQETVKI